MSYSGWRNYETWLVKLWLDNSQADQEYWFDAAQESAGPNDLAKRLEEELSEAADYQVDPGTLWSDLMGAALSEVDWYEIAEVYLEEAKEVREYAES